MDPPLNHDPEQVCVRIYYTDSRDENYMEEWFISPNAYKTYKEFITASLHFVQQDYLPVDSVTVVRADGTVKRVVESDFCLMKGDRYEIVVYNLLHEVRKVRQMLLDADQRFNTFIKKRC